MKLLFMDIKQIKQWLQASDHDIAFGITFNCDWIYGNRSKSHIGSYEIIDFEDFKDFKAL